MAAIVKQILVRPIQLADQVIKSADEARFFRQECSELKSKTEKLAALLRQAARASSDLYERPTCRIIEDTEQALDKALLLVSKCQTNGLVKRVFTINPASQLKKMSVQLENSIGNVSWLLRVSTSAANRDDEYLGMPPIATNEPILCFIWEQIATLCTGSLNERSEAAASLVSLADGSDRYCKLIIEEGGVAPLLKVAKEGLAEGQENAVRAIGLLGRDPESVEQLIHAGVCSVFVKILKEGSMKVQAIVAWAIAELVASHSNCQDHFSEHNTIRLLVGHLAFETVQEHSRYSVTGNKAMSIHSIVMANNTSIAHRSNEHNEGDELQPHSRIPHPGANRNQKNQMHPVAKFLMAGKSQSQFQHDNIINKSSSSSSNTVKQHQITLPGGSINGRRESEDPANKASMKAMTAKALWQLARGNNAICKSITESRALLCFSILLEKGPDDVKFYSAMALMEIAAVAEQDTELRRLAFKPTSPAAKAVVDQLIKIIDEANSNLLIPCIKAIGCLARTFRVTETRIIGPLVRLLDEREEKVTKEAAIALAKFASGENYLHGDHSKAIINEGGVKHLLQLVYLGERNVQASGLVLLCYIAMHVPDSEALAESEVLKVLEWASKQVHIAQDPTLEALLTEARGKLELYQPRGSRGFH